MLRIYLRYGILQHVRKQLVALLARLLNMGKARLTYYSVECFIWALGVMWVRVCVLVGLEGFPGFVVFFFFSWDFVWFVICILSIYLGAPNAIN